MTEENRRTALWNALLDEANQQFISAGYFETLRARLLQGRFFSEGDDASRPLVALII
jgi:macrolide transport system ATP-binding/permease protein